MIRLGDPKASDSLVFDAIPQLQVKIPDIGNSPQIQQSMPWEVFWAHVIDIIEKIRGPHLDGRYVPTTVVGITNGGLMFADLLCRDLFSGIPVVALWADRGHKKTARGSYFENPINNGIIEAIRATLPEKGSHSVLLVDDIVASGTTHSQAIDYLKNKLSGIEFRFLPLFSRNEKYYEIIKDHVLWKHEAFAMTDEEIKKIHWIDWAHLPYRKDIRSS